MCVILAEALKSGNIIFPGFWLRTVKWIGSIYVLIVIIVLFFIKSISATISYTTPNQEKYEKDANGGVLIFFTDGFFFLFFRQFLFWLVLLIFSPTQPDIKLFCTYSSKNSTGIQTYQCLKHFFGPNRVFIPSFRRFSNHRFLGKHIIFVKNFNNIVFIDAGFGRGYNVSNFVFLEIITRSTWWRIC